MRRICPTESLLMVRSGGASRRSRSRFDTAVPVKLMSAAAKPQARARSISAGEQTSTPQRPARARLCSSGSNRLAFMA
jgi:hypothetical protein